MSSDSRISHASCPARAALAGNPSDGHGGAVVATVVPAVAAHVTVTASDRFVIGGAGLEFDSLDDLDERLRSDGAGTVQPLVPATLAALHRFLGATMQPVEIDVSTTIPRSVGLAGSSAIVIATLRALIIHCRGQAWADHLATRPSVIASIALAAEHDVLGIPAGLQDRVVQSLGGTVSMDFATVEHFDGPSSRFTGGAYRRLGTVPGALFVAYLDGRGTDSGTVHAAVDSTDPAFLDAMHRSGEQARLAAAAIDAGNTVALATAMDATYDLRAAVMDLDPRHTEMVRVARSTGAAANFTGSGGAIVVSTATAVGADPARAALTEELGCRVLEVQSPR